MKLLNWDRCAPVWRTLLVVILGWIQITSCFSQTEEEIIPQPYLVDRYEPIWKKSPFTLSSATNIEIVAGFAENLALAGVVKIEGEFYAAILNKSTQKRELISNKPNSQGIYLAKIEAGSDPKNVVATLQKGEETSVLRYDLAALKISTGKSTPANENPQAENPSPANPKTAAAAPAQNSTPSDPPSPRVRFSRMIPPPPAPSGSPNQPANSGQPFQPASSKP